MKFTKLTMCPPNISYRMTQENIKHLLNTQIRLNCINSVEKLGSCTYKKRSPLAKLVSVTSPGRISYLYDYRILLSSGFEITFLTLIP